MKKLFSSFLSFVCVISAASACYAQTVPNHAQGLKEVLVVVDLNETKKQAGVFSMKSGFEQPTKLAVLLPGNPSVVRAVVENGSTR